MKSNIKVLFHHLFFGAVFNLLLSMSATSFVHESSQSLDRVVETSLPPAQQHLSQTHKNIVDAADGAVNHRMWRRSSTYKLTKKGRLGCAAAVSEVLQKADVQVGDTALAASLVDELLQAGWRWEYASGATMHPGDVIYGFRPGHNPHAGGGHAHIAIVGSSIRGQVFIYENSTQLRYWVKRELGKTRFARSDFGQNIFLLHPPEEFRFDGESKHVH